MRRAFPADGDALASGYMDSKTPILLQYRPGGLTGLAGDSFNLLDEHEFDFEQIHLVDTEEQAGGRHMVKGHSQRVEVLERFDFSQVAVVLFADAWLASDWADRVVAAGCVVVDACGAFRHRLDVPLVVAEVNPQALADMGARRSCPVPTPRCRP